ncbi:hypothetical protein T492DRAFT_878558, partial [Pavlovales sp. CCMP2436]
AELIDEQSARPIDKLQGARPIDEQGARSIDEQGARPIDEQQGAEPIGVRSV